MREIKFRGLCETDGKWKYGQYRNFKYYTGDSNLLDYPKPELIINEHFIDTSTDNKNAYRVKDETVGQYTGLKDRNGKEIYEGDILGADKNCRASGYYIVEWNQNHACFTSIEGGIDNFIGDIDEEIKYQLLSNMRFDRVEVIGNIYENPELLK